VLVGYWLKTLCRLAACAALALAVSAAARQAPQPPPPDPAGCGGLIPFLRVGIPNATVPARVIYGQPGERALLFLAGLKIDADGAPRAYHPDDAPGLDALANAKSDGRWVGLVTDRAGKPFVQRASDPAPGFYVSVTALENEQVADPADPRRYVDAGRVPYIVLPGGQKAKAAYRAADLNLGDIAIVYNSRTRTIAAAILADYGPAGALGEGSIKLADDLGYADTSPRHGGTGARENLFLVFPGSGAGFPRDLAHMQKTARTLLAAWGGARRLADCLEALH
jgi:hypothetical protein